MRSHRALLIMLTGLLLILGVTAVAAPSVKRYELSRRLDMLLRHATGPSGTGVADVGQLNLFAWDTLYVFRPFTPHEKVDAVLGFPWDDSNAVGIERRDDINLLVFSRGRSVVAYLALPRSRADFVQIAEFAQFTSSSARFHTHIESGSHVIMLTPGAP